MTEKTPISLNSECSFKTQSASCNSALKNKSCPLFSLCSDAHNNSNGDLTPSQFCEIHSELKIDQVIRILRKQKSFAPEDKTPLLSFDKIIAKRHIYIIPGTDICGLEGQQGRGNTCPNNPVRDPDQHIPKICRLCPEYPRIAYSTKSDLPPSYVPRRRQDNKTKPKTEI